MAWWDFLLSNPSTTAAIPPMLPPQPNFMGPGAYIGGRMPGGQNPMAGIHQSIYGSPFIPTPFDESPNTFRPGAQPGQLDVATKPPLPGGPPPMMGRQPVPAAMPMPGTLPEGANPPGAMGMGDLAFPGAMTPPASPAADTAKPPSWYDRNKDWITMASRDLGALGKGMLQAPPGYNAFGQGFANVVDDRERRLDSDLKRQLLKAQVGEVESKAEQRKTLRALYNDKSLPTALRLAAQTGDMAKFADVYMKLDPDTQRALAQNEAVKAAMVSAATLGDKLKVAEVMAGKAPAGYRWGRDGKLETIPGGPATHISADVAGRLAMMQTAQVDLQKSRDVFLREWGTKDVANAQIQAGDVGRAQRNVTLAIESALRAMTGAAAPESEVRKYEGMFMPKSYDTLETRKQKLALLEGFMQNAIKIATQGRGELPAAPARPASPAAPTTAPRGRSGTLPGGIKWSEE